MLKLEQQTVPVDAVLTKVRPGVYLLDLQGSLPDVHRLCERLEEELFERALDAAGGNVTAAGRLVGFSAYEAFVAKERRKVRGGGTSEYVRPKRRRIRLGVSAGG